MKRSKKKDQNRSKKIPKKKRPKKDQKKTKKKTKKKSKRRPKQVRIFQVRSFQPSPKYSGLRFGLTSEHQVMSNVYEITLIIEDF